MMTLQAITGFVLVTADPDRLTRYYRDTLGFAMGGDPAPIRDEEMALLGLLGTGSRQAMSLGGNVLFIDHFEAAGRPYPAQSDAAALSFQHFALVVPDIAAAFARLSAPDTISQGGPQHLPRSSGGVHAFKFRDPDGHPLEFLQFPAGREPPPWRGRRARDEQIGLGIDHSAISVADAEASLAFYKALGLSAGAPSVNSGPAQERLDGLRGVVVDVVPMRPATPTPHLELLGYRAPTGRDGGARKANDCAATRILWRGEAAALIRDPDGHLHQVQA